MRALIVEDSRVTRNILAFILQELGFETFEAENGREALEALTQANGADLILLDWNMPVMNGVECLANIRSNKAFAHIPVCMVTSEAERHAIVTALNAGANEYLMKPVTKEAMAEKLQLVFRTAV